MFLQVDGTIVIQLINFALFFAILNVVFLGPVSEAIRKRRAYIDSLTNDYDRYQGEASALKSEAETIRGAARREGEQLLARTRGATSNETAEIAARVADEVKQTVEGAHAEVARELEAARQGDERTVAELAELMIDRTLSGAA